MTKRIFGMLLALAMVLSMVPVAVVAESAGEVTATAKAGTHTGEGHSDDCGVTTGWQPWDEGDSLPVSGQYYLTKNVTLASEVTLTGDLILCLNGFAVTTTANARLIGTKNGTSLTFTVTDCTAYTENGVYHAGALTGGKDGSTGGGGAVFVRAGSTMKLYDGRITGNTSVTAAGAVCLQAASATLTGGKLYMYGGEVSHNTAISGTKYKTGGAFYLGNNAVFEMTGGTITGNTGSGGGVLYAVDNATVHIENATITGNTASYTGAVLHCAKGAVVTIKDSALTGNICTSSSGGGTIRMDGSKGKVTLSGDTVIAHNTLAASIGDIMLMSTYSDILNVNELTGGSYVRFCTPNTVPAAANEVIAVSGTQKASWNSGSVVFVAKDGTEKYIGYDGTTFSFVEGHIHDGKFFQRWDKTDSLPTEGSWCLSQDVKVSKEATVSGLLELCLNGRTVTGASCRAYTVNGTLNIYNCGTDGGFTGFNHSAHGGVIQNAGTVYAENVKFWNNSTSAGYGGAMLTSGTTTLKNCVFQKNSASQGGALSVAGTTVIENCSFTENSAASAGAIRVAGSKTVLIDGCSFTKNTATVVGAISATSNGVTLTLKDSTVTENTTTGGFGAVNVIGTAKSVKLQGKVTVTGNTWGGQPCNLHVQSGAVDGYDVTGLTAGSSLGISLQPARITANKLHFTTASANNNKAYFTSDNAEYQVTLGSDNKLQLAKKAVSNHKHTLCSDAACTDHTDILTYEPWTDATRLPAEGSWYLDTDVTVTAETAVSGKLNLCLNGHKITGSGCRAYNISGGATVNISDCTATGKITGCASTANGGAISNAGVLNLYDISFTGNTTASGSSLRHGGAIFSSGTVYAENVAFAENRAEHGYGGALLSSGPVTMKNCRFEGNTAQEGGAVSLAGQTVMTDCVFTKNVASAASGAARVAGSKTVLFDRCSFTENTAKAASAISATSNGVTLTLQDVTVTGNANTDGCGAVNVIGTAKPIILKGEVTVTGNTGSGTPQNLHVQSGVTDGYDVTGLTEGSALGISLQPSRISAGKLTFTTANENNNKDHFISDDGSYEIHLDTEGRLALKTPDPVSTHKHCLCSSGKSAYCKHEAVEFFDWTDPSAMPTSGSWCLTVDVTVPKTFGISKELNLCLNGHKVTVGEGAGRLYYVSTGGKLSITDCSENAGQITGATSTAILYNAKGTDMALNLWNGTLTDNHLVGGGGAIVIQGQCTFNMYGGKITGNSVTSALKLDAEGKPILDADGNQTYYASNGGGLFTGTGTVFNMYGGEITGNKATHVEYLKAGATKATKAGGSGGGVALYGSANLYGGKIAGNEAFLGGGVFVSGSTSVLNLLGTEISGNQATSAGGVLCQSKAVVNLEKGLIAGNAVTVSGAGIYISTNSKFHMTGGTVSGNAAKTDGGGIYLQKAEATVSGGSITGNAAERLGGGIYATEEGCKLTVSGGAIEKNKALAGGGVIAEGKAAFTMQGGKLAGNQTTSAGGGAYISVGSTFTMSGGQISGNTAKGDGGGLYLLRATTKLNGGAISGNTAPSGGGIKMNGGKLTLNGVSLTSNQATGKTTVSSTTGKTVQVPGYGGALVAAQGGYTVNGVEYSDTPVVEMYNAYIAGNHALSAAGGIQIVSQDSRFHMYGGTVTGNTAGSAGGGIYLSTNTVSTITGGTVSNNSAKNCGGVYFLNCTAEVSGLTLTGNTAEQSGGAAVIHGKTAVVNMKDMEISGNTAGGNAGAILMKTYATMTLQDAKVYGNTAKSAGGALYYEVPTYGSLKNVEFYENQATEGAGGAVYLSSNAIVTAESCTFRENTAGGSGGAAYNKGRLVLNGCKVLNNTSGKQGGGIGSGKVASALLSDQAGVFATATVISGNKAAEQGGGLYNNRGCPVYLTDCTVSENTSGTEGGGIYSDGRLGLTNLTMTQNTSGGAGFALYITPSEFDGHSYITGHKFVAGDMIIKDNQNGDIYLGEGTALAVTGEALGENSHMNVTLHSGVLSQWVHGIYDYEGGDLVYTITAGNRSITDPEPIPTAETEEAPTAQATAGDIALYVIIGVFAVAAAAVAVLVLKKKKASAKE